VNQETYSAACAGEYRQLMYFGNIFLWIAVIAAVVVTLLSIVERGIAAYKTLTAPRTAAGEAGGGADASGFLDSLKGLVSALAQAPPWFAIFLAGVALLWSGTAFSPSACKNAVNLVVGSAHQDGTQPTAGGGKPAAGTGPATPQTKQPGRSEAGG
jgi:hypothetical protein